MKRTTLSFLLGCCFIILLSATGVSKSELFTVKPATPKSIFVIECRSIYAVDYIKKYTKLGYVVKSFTAGAYYDYDGLLVLEKY